MACGGCFSLSIPSVLNRRATDHAVQVVTQRDQHAQLTKLFAGDCEVELKAAQIRIVKPSTTNFSVLDYRADQGEAAPNAKEIADRVLAPAARENDKEGRFYRRD
jgi:hypothetical protein